MARRLPATTRILIATSPLFAPTVAAGAFAVVYQRALGLTPAQIGALAGGVAALSPVFLFGGSFVARRWGRLQALTVFDTIGWVVPALILAVAQEPLHVALALLLGATAQGAQAAFQGLLVSRVVPSERARAFATHNLVLGVALASLPLAGVALVARWSLVPAVRLLYGVAAATVATMILLRYVLLARRGRGRRLVPRPPLAPRGFLEGLRVIRRAGISRILLGSVLLAFAGGLLFLGPVRIVEHVGLPSWWLGVLSTFAIAADLASTAIATRVRAHPRSWSLVGALAGFVSAGLFLLAREPLLFLASALAGGVASAWGLMGANALLHNAVPERGRDHAVAAHLALRFGATVAAPVLAGWLYSRHPDLPWLVALPVLLIVVFVWRSFPRSGAGRAGISATRARKEPSPVATRHSAKPGRAHGK